MKRFGAYKALAGFAVQAPVYALYYLSHGLDYRGLMLLALVFAAARFVCEVPAGIFADRVGRKAAILVRVALEAASVLVLFTGHLAVSSALAGAAIAFATGSEQAFVYEWRGREFARDFGRASSWSFASTAVAALAGGALATWSFEAVYALRLAALFAAAGVAATFAEPPRAAKRERETRKAGLPRLLAFVGILGAVHVAVAQLQQPLLRAAGVPLAALGAAFVGFHLATAVGARWAHRVRSPLAVLGLGSSAGFALLALPIGLGAVAAILGLRVLYGISLPCVGRALNDRAPSGSRATCLSLRSLLEGAALAIAAPALGWAADSISMAAAFGAAAVLVLPSLLLLMEAPCSASRSPVSSS